jgi:hypothetical protein
VSATRELIAAALTAADFMESDWLPPSYSKAAKLLREACARAMVQPDIAEFERLAHAYADAKLTRYGLLSDNPALADPQKAFAALMAHVEAMHNEGGAGVHFTGHNMLAVAPQQEGAPDDWQDAPPKNVGHYPMTKPVGEVLIPVGSIHRAHLKPQDGPWCKELLMYSPDNQGDTPDSRVMLYAAAPQPVGEVPMPMPRAIGVRFDGTLLHKEVDVRTYGEQCRAAGYAAGMAAVREYAVSRWKAEVDLRPLENKHRRTLDDVWRQVISHTGGDPEALLGLSHDALAALRGEVK